MVDDCKNKGERFVAKGVKKRPLRMTVEQLQKHSSDNNLSRPERNSPAKIPRRHDTLTKQEKSSIKSA